MANKEHVDLLKQGVPQWNELRKHDSRSDLHRAHLNNADLSGADLSGAFLEDAHLSGSDLRSTNLYNADLSGADLSGADLSGSNLSGANLQGANLQGTILCNALLDSTNLSGADLHGANMSKAGLFATILARVDLSETKGLIEINHLGPSDAALHTIRLPQDGSAIHFLRGVGIPEEWIDFYRAQMMSAIQYYSCFISYSNKDDLLARRLHADLQMKGVRCWFAPEDMKIGDEIRSRIEEMIRLQDKLLLLLSEHSIASTWVKNEVEAAFEKEEKLQHLVLFRVRLDESIVQATNAWAATLHRTRYIGDFTCWTEPQAYQQAFNRLLRDLKAETSKKDE